MKKLCDFINKLPAVDTAADFCVYPESVNAIGADYVFMVRGEEADLLVATGEAAKAFEGEVVTCDACTYVLAPKTHKNAIALRAMFDFTAPKPVLKKLRTFGVGDRLGIATPGHIRVFKEYDTYPILAQQSIRELNLTERGYEDVLDAATFYVFRDGYKDGFGADGDHLKKAEEIEYALGLGFTMITLDCSEHIRGGVEKLTPAELAAECTLCDELAARYVGADIEIEGEKLVFDADELRRCVLIYGDAIKFAIGIYNKYFKDGGANADFEISIDETATPTSPLQHYFVANELIRAGVDVATMAPRFCGEFQKGVDYIGDIAQFERELKTHAAIARHFGYKLSIHSGSDKFSTFALIGKYTQGNFHVKTAGTNWLEAMRAVAAADPALYREVHAFALSMFDEARKFYHVTTDLNKVPALDTLSDAELPNLFTMNDARQLIHITYGFILTEKNADGSYRFKDRLYKFWREKEDVYSDMLYAHIGKHLTLLYDGFRA